MLKVDDGRIESTADPFEPVVVLFVVRISDGVEELAVAPGTADVVRWTAPGGLE